MTTADGTGLSLLGLGAREDAFARGVARAAEAGVNFFFIYHLSKGRWAAAMRELAVGDRAGVALTCGSGSRDPAGLQRARDAYLDAFGSDYLDVFFAEYVHPGDDEESIHGDDGVLAELADWKAQGIIRYVGATAHDRDISLGLAEDPRVDVLMQRYNMAHRKAADAVLPACAARGVAVVAFTATRWGSLLEGHDDWGGEPPSALDCYRFCAAHPAVDVVLAAPSADDELEEDLELIDAPPMTAAEHARWERYGDLVYGSGRDGFETDWP